MSDLGAIFHVKKDGVQYDAHAYTTLDECPYPNLKIKFNGTNAFVKLVNRGSGDVPLYVKVSSGEVFQVKKEAIPSGRLLLNNNFGYPGVPFTVPKDITRIKVTYYHGLRTTYVAVTPNSYHLLWFPGGGDARLVCREHRKEWTMYYVVRREQTLLEWSSEINKHPPDLWDN